MQSLKLYYKNNFSQSLRITRNQTFLPYIEQQIARKFVKCISQKFRQIQERSARQTRLQMANFSLKTVQIGTHSITCHYSAELQTVKQTLTTSKNSIEFTYSEFPCHLKVNRNKLALISCLWKCKNGESLMITANSFTKIDQLDGFRPL